MPPAKLTFDPDAILVNSVLVVADILFGVHPAQHLPPQGTAFYHLWNRQGGATCYSFNAPETTMI